MQYCSSVKMLIWGTLLLLKLYIILPELYIIFTETELCIIFTFTIIFTDW